MKCGSPGNLAYILGHCPFKNTDCPFMAPTRFFFFLVCFGNSLFFHPLGIFHCVLFFCYTCPTFSLDIIHKTFCLLPFPFTWHAVSPSQNPSEVSSPLLPLASSNFLYKQCSLLDQLSVSFRYGLTYIRPYFHLAISSAYQLVQLVLCLAYSMTLKMEVM